MRRLVFISDGPDMQVCSKGGVGRQERAGVRWGDEISLLRVEV